MLHGLQPDEFETVADADVFKYLNFLKLNDFQSLFDGLSSVDVKLEGVSNALNFAYAFGNGFNALGYDAVTDDQKIIEARTEAEQGFVLAFDGDQIVNQTILARRVIIERISSTFGEDVVLSAEVDGEFSADVPR